MIKRTSTFNQDKKRVSTLQNRGSIVQKNSKKKTNGISNDPIEQKMNSLTNLLNDLLSDITKYLEQWQKSSSQNEYKSNYILNQLEGNIQELIFYVEVSIKQLQSQQLQYESIQKKSDQSTSYNKIEKQIESIEQKYVTQLKKFRELVEEADLNLEILKMQPSLKQQKKSVFKDIDFIQKRKSIQLNTKPQSMQNNKVDVNLSNQSSDLSGEYIYDPNKKKPLTNDEIMKAITNRYNLGDQIRGKSLLETNPIRDQSLIEINSIKAQQILDKNNSLQKQNQYEQEQQRKSQKLEQKVDYLTNQIQAERRSITINRLINNQQKSQYSLQKQEWDSSTKLNYESSGSRRSISPKKIEQDQDILAQDRILIEENHNLKQSKEKWMEEKTLYLNQKIKIEQDLFRCQDEIRKLKKENSLLEDENKRCVDAMISQVLKQNSLDLQFRRFKFKRIYLQIIERDLNFL